MIYSKLTGIENDEEVKQARLLEFMTWMEEMRKSIMTIVERLRNRARLERVLRTRVLDSVPGSLEGSFLLTY